MGIISKKKYSLVSIFALALLVSLAIFSKQVIAAPPDVPPGLLKAMEVQDKNTPSIMSNPDVVGTGVGLNSIGKPVIHVFTVEEGVRGIPSSLDGFPVEVIVTGEIFALHHRPGHSGGPGVGDPTPTPTPTPDPGSGDPTSRFDRPVPIGVSTGHPAITAGTIGCRVTDGANVYALSNNHVYANQNLASLDDAVIQPGDYDGGISPADDIGILDGFVDIIFGNTDCLVNPDVNCNEIDAAIAMTTTDDLGDSTPSDGYGTPNSTTASAFVGQDVQKYGRTTSNTKGDVVAINATVDVNYGNPLGYARFTNQIVITPGTFSKGGDSGSLIVTDDANKNPVGLLFAGSPSYTIANMIDPVLDAFNVTVDDGAAAVSCGSDFDYCDDGDACNGTETCDGGGSCLAGTPVDCDDANACTTDSCDTTTGCVNDPINCDDSNLCTDDSCDNSTGCVNTDNTDSCDDGDACTTSDTCSAGFCVGGPNNPDCSPCLPVGALCPNGDADCCSNKCKGKRGAKTCK